MKIAVTGGSGKLGRTVVAVLTAAGHEVVTLDANGARGPGLVRVDLTNYGETIDAFLARTTPRPVRSRPQNRRSTPSCTWAAIPAPGLRLGGQEQESRPRCTRASNAGFAACSGPAEGSFSPRTRRSSRRSSSGRRARGRDRVHHSHQG